ncbi:MAG: alanine--tRNA ligase [Candidatus Woesearchaeota archaeon]
MTTDAELKDQFKKTASADPDRYFPTKTLKELGFARHTCSKCKRYFWTVHPEQKVCGDPACSGGFRFIGKPQGKKLSYIEVWKKFAEIHQKLGYTPIKRYPVVARWNPTTEFTIASIAAFQPYVVSGEVKPPANPLVIPQFSLRFGDIDNVGITGHFVCFIMMGQHGFFAPKDYDINKYIKHHITWLTEGMGLKIEDLTIHEDGWAGGGNFGPCMEFFSHGLEISNQVYMQYEATATGSKELAIKVLDMGQGQERAAWFTQGTATAYDATFPEVLKKLTKATGVKIDQELMKKFLPLTPYLNVGEVADLDKAWKEVASKIGMDVKELRERVEPIAAVYAIAEHARALLIALTDGALPSNVGGMYNLRVILRRALGFIDKYNWKVDLCDVCDWHAAELKPLFPELSEQLANVRKILEVEKMRYRVTQEKTKTMLSKIASQELKTEDLIKLYDSQGIAPELVAEEAAKQGKKVNFPKNFYSMVAKLHESEKKEQETQTERETKLPLDGIPDTEILYWGDWKPAEFKAKVLKIIGNNVVLDKTDFYPVSGGQVADHGELGGGHVVDAFKQGGVIVHVLAEKPEFKQGDTVTGRVDLARRKQLSQHHTSTHIINAAARTVLGPHCNQASAKKDIDKAYLDITHYQTISDDELLRIEEEANKIVKKNAEVVKSLIPREEAEKKYGMAIYQGGAVPGKHLRIIEIKGIDVEACGGTHLNSTAEAEQIKILKSNKVKDGVVRIYFCAGEAAKKIIAEEKDRANTIAKLLDCKPEQVPGRAQELFDKWKKARKAASKKQPINSDWFILTSKDEYKGDIVAKTAEILQTQPEFIAKTIERFRKDLDEYKKSAK